MLRAFGDDVGSWPLARLGAIAFFVVSAIVFWRNEYFRRVLPRSENRSTEVPVGKICGAAWFESRRVALVGLCGYSRVQAYDATGRFLYGWFVPGRGDRFALSQAAPDLLRVIVTRGRREFYYDGSGQLTNPSPKGDDGEGTQKPDLRVSHVELVTRNTALWSKVDITERGRHLGVVRTPASAIPCREPFPAFLYPFLAVAFEAIHRRNDRRDPVRSESDQ